MAGDAKPGRAGSGRSIFDAVQDQLGLKLESRQLPLPVVVIDHLERTASGNQDGLRQPHRAVKLELRYGYQQRTAGNPRVPDLQGRG